MEKISKIKGYDEYGYEVMEFSLPTMDFVTSHVQDFGRALASFGLNADQAAEAIARVSEALSRLDVIESVIDYGIESKVGRVEVETDLLKNRSNRIERDVFLLREDLNDIRSALDAKTEKPNQNSDLEIFNQIEVNPFLPNFVDLDSERPLWDFTVDF